MVIGPEHVGRQPGCRTPPSPGRPRDRVGPHRRAATESTTEPAHCRPHRRAAAPEATPGQAWPGRRVARIALVVLVAFSVLVAGLFFFGWWQFSRIERVNVASALSAGGGKGTNYLIVGSDSRQGISNNSPNSGAFLGETVSGERTDTIMVLRIEGSKSYLLSIPRDLWVKNPATGEMGRINATYQSGPTALIQAVRGARHPGAALHGDQLRQLRQTGRRRGWYHDRLPVSGARHPFGSRRAEGRADASRRHAGLRVRALALLRAARSTGAGRSTARPTSAAYNDSEPSCRP